MLRLKMLRRRGVAGMLHQIVSRMVGEPHALSWMFTCAWGGPVARNLGGRGVEARRPLSIVQLLVTVGLDGPHPGRYVGTYQLSSIHMQDDVGVVASICAFSGSHTTGVLAGPSSVSPFQSLSKS